MRREPALALLVLGWAATLWLAPFSDESVNDLYVYRVFTEAVLDGGLPYRDAFFEYPPLAAPAIALPGLAGTGEELFRAAFAAWTLLLAAAVVLLCGALAARSGGSARRALLAVALMPLLCGAMVRTHFDLAPVALMLGALLLLVAERPRAGMALLGLAALAKGFPLVAAPVALVWLARRAGRRTAAQAGAVLLVTLAAGAGAALWLSPSGAWEAVSYHAQRPVQIESLAATAVNALELAGAGEAESVQSHRSDGLEHPAAAALALVAALALLGVLVFLALRSPTGARGLVLGALSAVLAFALFGRVLSPQYLIWLVPLGALAVAWHMRALAAALAAAALLTQLEFPARYFDLVAREPFPLALVAARNLALLVALVLAMRQLELLQRQQDLLDRDRPPALALDQHRVEPRVLV